MSDADRPGDARVAEGEPTTGPTDGPPPTAIGPMTEATEAPTPAASVSIPNASAPTAARPTVSATAPAAGADLDRRRFFRQFATDVFHTAATVVGAATALQRSSMDAASAILNGTEPGNAVGAAPTGPIVGAPTSSGYPGSPSAGAISGPGGSPAVQANRPVGLPGPAVGYHSAFRVEGERLILVDQRRLPFALVEVECRSAIEVANEILAGAMTGGPAVGQAAALGLAMSAVRVRGSRPYGRRAILRAAETTLLAARPTSRLLRAAVERVMARHRALGELDEDGDRIAAAMQAEADAIVFEANDDHGRIAEAAVARMPARTERPAGVLLIGAAGALGGGQFGPALGVVQAAVYAGRDVHAYVLEGRPGLAGARVTAWELAQAGIPFTVLPDAAAGWLLAGGDVDLVLVGAEAIARNGDLANDVGTYPVAALAGRHNVPVIACAPLAAVEPDAADGRSLATGERPSGEVTTFNRERLFAADTPVRSPVLDVTPAGLLTAIATEEGLLEGSFGTAIESALARRALRLPASLAGGEVVGAAMEWTTSDHGAAVH